MPATLQKHSKVFSLVLLGIFLLFFSLLLVTAIKSGYSFEFDVDETFHSQAAYLMATGNRVYDSFYYIGYTPLLSWILIPFYKSVNFAFEALYTGRYLMILMFVARLALIANAMRMLFGKKAMIIAPALMLLDTVTVFTGFQIRPDNLMLVFYLLGLNFLIVGYKKPLFLFFAGASLSLSVLSMLKIGPSVVILGIIVLLWFLKKRYITHILYFISGGISICLLFFGYFAVFGNISELIHQLFIYPPKMFVNFQFPLPFGFFYQGNNVQFFGMQGKPLQWFFTWLLLLLSGGGMVLALMNITKEKIFSFKHALLCVFVLSFFVQFYFVAVVQSPFLQYYIPFHFFAQLLATYAIIQYLDIFEKRTSFSAAAVLGIIVFILFAVPMAKGNMVRSQFTADAFRTTQEQLWSRIPKDQAVFPRVLFRPIVAKIAWNHFLGDASPFLVDMLPDFNTFLETYPVNYIHNEPYLLSFYPSGFQEYLKNNYVPSDETGTVLIHK